MPKDYDFGAAFARIEEELIDSMMRNLQRYHLDWEDAEGFDWPQWQVQQLQYLEEYRKRNAEKFGPRFSSINVRLEEALHHAYENGQKAEEIRILESLVNNRRVQRQLTGGIQGAGDAFFRVNDRKLEALLNATVSDMRRAEQAVLRRANDQCRKIIFNAQMYANTGAGTVQKAVDMATKDFLMRGIDCIEYRNGARHTISDYADMAIRTAERRAYLWGEGQKRQEWGVSLVIVNKRGGHPCPDCAEWVGKILIDDVYSGGKPDGKHTLLSEAMDQGFLHPRCKDGFTTYFPGVTSVPDPATKEELKAAEAAEAEEARQQNAERMAERWERRARYALDPADKRTADARAEEWRQSAEARPFVSQAEEIMRRARSEYGEGLVAQEGKKDFSPLSESGVVDKLRQEARTWIAKLSKAEKRSIRKYTYNSGDKRPNRFFERLNGMLRGDQPHDTVLAKHADLISSAIKKNALANDVIAYRGVSVDPTAGIPIGGVFRMPSFVSTSVIESRAFGREYLLVIDVPKGSRAAYIEELSKFPDQRELLLDKGCMFRVKSRRENVVEIEVIA